jgi:hypothetical protein
MWAYRRAVLREHGRNVENSHAVTDTSQGLDNAPSSSVVRLVKPKLGSHPEAVLHNRPCRSTYADIRSIRASPDLVALSTLHVQRPVSWPSHDSFACTIAYSATRG